MRICEIEPFESVFINVRAKTAFQKSEETFALAIEIYLPHSQFYRCSVARHLKRCSSTVREVLATE